MEKFLCYLDKNLKLVTNVAEADAVLDMNEIGLYEAVFFEPVAHDINPLKGFDVIKKWKETYRPQGIKLYTSYPSLQICKLANQEHKKSKDKMFSHCITNTAIVDHHGRTEGFWGIGEVGRYFKAQLEETQQNIYVSVLVWEKDLKEINPDFNPENYKFSR